MPTITDILQNNPIAIVISFLAAIVTLLTFILSILKFRIRSHRNDLVTTRPNNKAKIQDRNSNQSATISPGKWVGGGALFFGVLFCFCWICLLIFIFFTSTFEAGKAREVGESFGKGFWFIGLLGALFGALLGYLCWCIKEVVRRVLRT